MALSSVSQLILESQVKVDDQALVFYRKLQQYLSDIDLLTPKTQEELSGLLQTATALAKTPFLSRQSLSEAATIIGELQAKITTLREQFPSQSLTELFKGQSTLKDFDLFTRGYAQSMTRLNDIDRANARAIDEQTGIRIAAEKQQVLAQIENEKRSQSNVLFQQKLIERATALSQKAALIQEPGTLTPDFSKRLEEQIARIKAVSTTTPLAQENLQNLEKGLDLQKQLIDQKFQAIAIEKQRVIASGENAKKDFEYAKMQSVAIQENIAFNKALESQRLSLAKQAFS